MPLEAVNLYYKYNNKADWVLKDVNLKVEKGERLAIIAPSGFGKSTLALLLSSYLKPDRGNVFLDGKELPRKGLCPVQLIYQHPEKSINPRWKLRKVLEECGNIDYEILALFGIENEWLDRFPCELSGGELQRFCVARALMSGAEYIICDEITTMLDLISQAQIWEIILKIAEERDLGLIIITHNKYLADRVATRKIDISK